MDEILITEEQKRLTCCFTGHRNIIVSDALALSLRNEIKKAYEIGIRTFCAGGALGFDTLAARVVLRLRETELPDIKLSLVLPFYGQEQRWSLRDRERYSQLLSQADSVEYTGEHYTKQALFNRNRRLVARSSYCIAYLNAESGGTFFTVALAKKKGLTVVNLAEREEEYLFNLW